VGDRENDRSALPHVEKDHVGQGRRQDRTPDQVEEGPPIRHSEKAMLGELLGARFDAIEDAICGATKPECRAWVAHATDNLPAFFSCVGVKPERRRQSSSAQNSSRVRSFTSPRSI
jgi:hypothetical protein